MLFKNSLLKTLAVATALTITGSAFTKPSQNAPAHLLAAEALSAKLRSQGEAGQFLDASGKTLNNYGASWKNAYAVWGPVAKVDAVCSSFVTLTLQASYPGWTAKGVGFSSTSPNAAMYYDAIEANSKGFQKVANFNDIAPGDFLIAKYFDNSNNSGHSMIVSEAVIVDEDEDTGIQTWAVTVIDCSSGFHSNDSRVFTLANNTTYISKGVGRGTMRVFAKDGEILAYSWSFANGSKIYTPETRALTLGRLAP